MDEKRSLDAALRVDQAGEVAANYIYMGQLAVLGRDPVCGPLIQVSSIIARLLDCVACFSDESVRKCGIRKRNT